MEKIASTGSSSSSASRSETISSTRSPNSARFSRACSIIDGDAVDADHPALGQPLADQPRHPAAAAAGVEHRLVAVRARAGRAPPSPTPPAARRPGGRCARPSRPAARSRIHRPQLRGLGDRLDPDRLGRRAPVDARSRSAASSTLPTASCICAPQALEHLLVRPRLALDVREPTRSSSPRPRPRWPAGRGRPGSYGRRGSGRPPAWSARWRPRRQARSRARSAFSAVIWHSSAAGTRTSQGTVRTSSRPISSPPGKPRMKRRSRTQSASASRSRPDSFADPTGDVGDRDHAARRAARARARRPRPTLPKPWTAIRRPSRSQPNASKIALEAEDDPEPGGVAAHSGPAEDLGLAGDDRGHRLAVALRVGVHDPGHVALAGRHVGGADVAVGSDDRLELGRVAADDPLRLARRRAGSDRSARRPWRPRREGRAERTCRSSTSPAPRTRRARPRARSGSRPWSGP